MKKKLLIFTFMVFVLSTMFTVSASASWSGVIYDNFSSDEKTFELSSSDLTLKVDGTSLYAGNHFLLDLGEHADKFLGLSDGASKLPVVFLGENLSVLTKRFLYVCYDVGDGKTLKILSNSEVLAGMSCYFTVDDGSLLMGTTYSGDAFSVNGSLGECLVSCDENGVVIAKGYGKFYEAVIDAIDSDGLDGMYYQFSADDDSVYTKFNTNLSGRCFVVIDIPNCYDVGYSVYDLTTERWNYKRLASADVTSSASSYQLVDHDGKLAFKLVNSSGTSYHDVADLTEELSFCFADDKLTGSFISSGFTSSDLPMNLLSRDANLVDDTLTVYVGEAAPVYFFLEEMPDATLNDVVQRFSDMIIMIPLLEFFIVLLPLISFGVGLLLRVKKS